MTAHGVYGINYRRVLLLAVPIILANLTQPLMSAVDTAVAGHLPGAEHLAGVAIGSLLFNFLFWGFGFLRMGTTGVVAQSFGVQDHAAVLLSVARGILIALAIGLTILVLQQPLIWLGIKLLGASAEAATEASLYAHGRIWAAPFALINYVILGWLLGCQRVRMALALQILINIVNLITVLALVYGLNWGVSGIGRATALADFSGTAVGGLLLWRSYRDRLSVLRWHAVNEAAAMRRLLQINSDLFVRTLCLLGTMAWFTHLGARQGDAWLAANAILLNFLSFASYGLDGFAHATETLAGAAIGRRDGPQLRQVLRIGLVWGLVGALAYAIVYGRWGENLIGLLTDQREIAELASVFLPWAALAPLISMPAYLYDGIFLGATQTRPMLLVMLACTLTFLLAAWACTPLLGNHGLWLAFMVFNALRGLGLSLLFRPVIARPLQEPTAPTKHHD